MSPAEKVLGDRLAAHLNAQEREEMRRDIDGALSVADRTGSWAEYRNMVDAWQATAEAAGGPALLAELLAEVDPAEEVPLRRP